MKLLVACRNQLDQEREYFVREGRIASWLAASRSRSRIMIACRTTRPLHGEFHVTQIGNNPATLEVVEWSSRDRCRLTEGGPD
jgi:hypothetical protein